MWRIRWCVVVQGNGGDVQLDGTIICNKVVRLEYFGDEGIKFKSDVIVYVDFKLMGVFGVFNGDGEIWWCVIQYEDGIYSLVI